jgi:hypothetical protein
MMSMKSVLLATVAVVSIASFLPAQANTIVGQIQPNIPLGIMLCNPEYSASNCPLDINVPEFNPNSGTLQSATLEITGAIIPDLLLYGTFIDQPPPASVTLTSSLWVHIADNDSGSPINYNIGFTETMPLHQSSTDSYSITGTPYDFDLTYQLDPADVTSAIPFDPSNPLSNSVYVEVSGSTNVVGLYSSLGFTGGNVSNPDGENGYPDIETYAVASATMTYDYNVPEPASMTLFGVGIFGLGWLRHRAIARRTECHRGRAKP